MGSSPTARTNCPSDGTVYVSDSKSEFCGFESHLGHQIKGITMSHRTKINPEEIKAFLEANPNSKVYIGCDSEKVSIKDVWYADYATVVVVHINGRHGCKVFGQVDRERVYDQNPGKPRMRLMTEVMKVAELYLSIAAVMGEDFECDIHLTSTQTKCSVRHALSTKQSATFAGCVMLSQWLSHKHGQLRIAQTA